MVSQKLLRRVNVGLHELLHFVVQLLDAAGQAVRRDDQVEPGSRSQRGVAAPWELPRASPGTERPGGGHGS